VRILVVTQQFHPSVGGAEVMLRRLAAAWTKTGCKVAVLTQRHDRNVRPMETLDGVSIIRLPVLKFRVLGTLHFIATLRRQLAASEGAFDLLFVSMFKHAAYAALTTKWKRRPPIVLRAEGAGPTGDMAWQDGARFGKTIRRACQRADAFVAPSRQTADELRARGYRADAIHEIVNGVPIPERPWRVERVAASRLEVGLSNRPTVVYTGRLHADKGLSDLVDAAAILHREGSPVALCLVGDGPERESLQRRAEERGIAASVRFPGAVANVEPYLRAADLFILPSYQEGLSVSLLEALALGAPCIASDIPANAGLVPDALLPRFPVRNPEALAAAMKNRLANPATQLAEQRRLVGERFSLDASARKHLEAFRRTLADSGVQFPVTGPTSVPGF
jgi:glycosyltransferase involved in cell wall biosynthesis